MRGLWVVWKCKCTFDATMPWLGVMRTWWSITYIWGVVCSSGWSLLWERACSMVCALGLHQDSHRFKEFTHWHRLLFGFNIFKKHWCFCTLIILRLLFSEHLILILLFSWIFLFKSTRASKLRDLSGSRAAHSGDCVSWAWKRPLIYWLLVYLFLNMPSFRCLRKFFHEHGWHKLLGISVLKEGKLFCVI